MNLETPYRRPDRVAHQILQIIGEIASRNVDISHLGFVTFTKVDLTSDLKLANIFYSVIQPKFDIEKITERLNGQRSVFRKYLGAEMRIKYTPELKFFHDDALDYAEKLERVFKDIHSAEDEIDN